jgi:hypothetical protein
MNVKIGFVEFDALATPFSVSIGWAEFDTQATPYRVNVGWAELDTRSPNNKPTPFYTDGGGVSRYYSHAQKQYEIELAADAAGELEEEEMILALLMEITAHVL